MSGGMAGRMNDLEVICDNLSVVDDLIDLNPVGDGLTDESLEKHKDAVLWDEVSESLAKAHLAAVRGCEFSHIIAVSHNDRTM